MASLDKSEMPFIFTDSMGKTEPANRKMIRKHVMLGKNRGKTRKPKPIKSAPAYDSEDHDGRPGVLINMRYPKIPNKVGSEFSFTQFASPVEQPLLHDILRFSFMAKRVMYPLESCIVFHRNTKVDASWFGFLTSDAAYMHAAVFTSQSYIALTSLRNDPATTRAAMVHYSATLRILRDRLSLLDTEKVSDPTVLAVLYLALHAHFTNDHGTAKHHIEGLRKIVDTRGGLNAFGYNTKMIIELLKCDLGIALNNGTEPTFLNDLSSDPLMEYDVTQFGKELSHAAVAEISLEPAHLDISISEDLSQAWAFLSQFCCTLNTAAEHKRQLSKDILLNTMTPLMYRLIRMGSCGAASIDETIRLGLLVFSSHIFLSWRSIKLPLTHLSNSYRKFLLNPKLSGILPPRLLVWLLTIASISIFTLEDEAWLGPWMRANIDSCGIHNWDKLRGQLKTFPWIDILHDEPGQAIFGAVMLLQDSGVVR